MKKLIQACMVMIAFAFVVSTSVFAADSGADVFKTKCASCHGATGAGDTAMGKSMKLKDLGSAEGWKLTHGAPGRGSETTSPLHLGLPADGCCRSLVATVWGAP